MQLKNVLKRAGQPVALGTWSKTGLGKPKGEEEIKAARSLIKKWKAEHPGNVKVYEAAKKAYEAALKKKGISRDDLKEAARMYMVRASGAMGSAQRASELLQGLGEEDPAWVKEYAKRLQLLKEADAVYMQYLRG